MSYIKRILSMLMTPQAEWLQVSGEHPDHRQCVSRIFAPMLVFELAVTAASLFLWNDTVNAEQTVFRYIDIVLRNVGGYYIVKYLAYKYLDWRCKGIYLAEDSEKVVAYGFVFLMLTESLVILFGNLLVLYVFYFFIAVQYHFAFGTVLDSDEGRRPELTAVFFALTAGVPNLIRLLLHLLLTNAPV